MLDRLAEEIERLHPKSQLCDANGLASNLLSSFPGLRHFYSGSIRSPKSIYEVE
jgi:hypothetical protein